jgi:hypothetical protein
VQQKNIQTRKVRTNFQAPKQKPADMYQTTTSSSDQFSIYLEQLTAINALFPPNLVISVLSRCSDSFNAARVYANESFYHACIGIQYSFISSDRQDVISGYLISI